MPTISISQEQADALAAGKDITIEAPVPTVRWNTTYIPALPHGRTPGRQMWHDDDIMAPADEPHTAAKAFVTKSISSDVRRYGGIVAVCPRDTSLVKGKPYMLSTTEATYFRLHLGTTDLTPGV